MPSSRGCRIDYCVIDFNGYPLLYSDKGLIGDLLRYISSDLLGINPIIIIFRSDRVDIVSLFRIRSKAYMLQLVALARISSHSIGDLLSCLMEYIDLEDNPFQRLEDDMYRMQLVLKEYSGIVMELTGDMEFINKMRVGTHKPYIVDPVNTTPHHGVNDLLAKYSGLEVFRDALASTLYGILDKKTLYMSTCKPVIAPLIHYIVNGLLGVNKHLILLLTCGKPRYSIWDRLKLENTVLYIESYRDAVYKPIDYSGRDILELLTNHLIRGDREVIEVAKELFSRGSGYSIFNTYFRLYFNKIPPRELLDTYLYIAQYIRGSSTHRILLKRLIEYIISTNYKYDPMKMKMLLQNIVREEMDYTRIYKYLVQGYRVDELGDAVDIVCIFYSGRMDEETRARTLSIIIDKIDRLRECEHAKPENIIREIISLGDKHDLLLGLGAKIGFDKLVDLMYRHGFKEELLHIPRDQRVIEAIYNLYYSIIRNRPELLDMHDWDIIIRLNLLGRIIAHITSDLWRIVSSQGINWLVRFYKVCLGIGECRQCFIEHVRETINRYLGSKDLVDRLKGLCIVQTITEKLKEIDNRFSNELKDMIDRDNILDGVANEVINCITGATTIQICMYRLREISSILDKCRDYTIINDLLKRISVQRLTRHRIWDPLKLFDNYIRLRNSIDENVRRSIFQSLKAFYINYIEYEFPRIGIGIDDQLNHLRYDRKWFKKNLKYAGEFESIIKYIDQKIALLKVRHKKAMHRWRIREFLPHMRLLVLVLIAILILISLLALINYYGLMDYLRKILHVLFKTRIS